jgi:transposase
MVSPAKPLAIRKKTCNAVIKTSILNARKSGMKVGDIVSCFEVSESTVFRILRSSRLTGVIRDNNCFRSGRKKKTTPEMDEYIISSVEDNRKLLPSQIRVLLQDKFGLSLGLTQIKERLRKAGLHGRVCMKKPLLSPVNKFKRLVWAYKHKDWTVEQWNKVLWTDEKKFELFNTKRRTYCRRRTNEKFREDTVQGTVKHGGGSLMVWGSIGNATTGNICKVSGIMDQHVYRGILAEQVFPSAKGGYFHESLSHVKKGAMSEIQKAVVY